MPRRVTINHAQPMVLVVSIEQTALTLRVFAIALRSLDVKASAQSRRAAL